MAGSAEMVCVFSGRRFAASSAVRGDGRLLFRTTVGGVEVCNVRRCVESPLEELSRAGARKVGALLGGFGGLLVGTLGLVTGCVVAGKFCVRVAERKVRCDCCGTFCEAAGAVGTLVGFRPGLNSWYRIRLGSLRSLAFTSRNVVLK